MTTESITERAALEVHVLGAGRGESIVLKLPNSQWGVVDCYAPSATDPATNPTISFLRDRGVKDLQFVCLTHPHDDHFLGMVKLIEEFHPREFWRVGCLSPEHVRMIARYYRITAAATGLEQFSRSARELLGVFARVREGVARGEMKVLRANSRMILYPLPADEPGSFRIECIAPSGNQIELYEGAIWSCMGPDGQIAGKLTRSQHNNISLVVKITYGETTILLGGDLEKEGWSQAIGEYGRDQLNASAVKVSHHGSENGYCDNLWEHFSSRGKPVAVITPSRLHRLPNPDALQHINQYACAIYATCQIWSDSSEAPIPRPTPPPPINSRLAIRRAFLAVPGVDDETQSGRCTLTFDDQGKCQIELDNHAQRLRIE